MFSLFQRSNTGPANATDLLIKEIRSTLSGGASMIPAESVKKGVFAAESLTETEREALSHGQDSLRVALESIADQAEKFYAQSRTVSADGELKFTNKIASHQRSAALQAGVMSYAAENFLSHDPYAQPKLTDAERAFTEIRPAYAEDMIPHRKYGSQGILGLEAYDTRENKETTTYTMAFNMQAATQDEFGDAFFPTCIVPPDQYGVTISVRLVQVMDDLRRQTSGAGDRNFNRLTIIRAQIDPDILRNDLTKMIPVVRPENLQDFVDPALVPPAVIVHEGQSIETAPLAIGASFDLMGISQTDAQLAQNQMDTTDAIDPNVVLEKLYMEVTDGTNKEVVKFPFVSQMNSSTFVQSAQDDTRISNLNFITDSLPVNAETTLADNSASQILKPIVDGKYSVQLAVVVNGNVNLQTGWTVVNAGRVQVAKLFDQDNNELSITEGPGKAIADLFKGAAIIGYDLEARRVNTNRRDRGQLLDITFKNVIYGVPLLSPITAVRPPMGPQQDESQYLAGLITTARVRTSNGAVAELIRAENLLKQVITSNLGDKKDVKPDFLGVGGWYVQPQYLHDEYDATQVVDSLKSYERAADVQASLVNMIREMTYRMYRDSGLKAAANAHHGGVAPMPTVIIGTDTYIASYLMVTGDFRTLGNEFNVKVVSTTNKLMKGKILFSFGEFYEGRENTPNPLHFGMMAYKPELVLILPTVRNGANNREISVSPAFRHIVNLPILGSIDVTGIDEVVTKKVTLNVHSA